MTQQFIEWYTLETGDSVSGREKMILGHWESWKKENPEGTVIQFADERKDKWLDPITWSEAVLLSEFEGWRRA